MCTFACMCDCVLVRVCACARASLSFPSIACFPSVVSERASHQDQCRFCIHERLTNACTCVQVEFSGDGQAEKELVDGQGYLASTPRAPHTQPSRDNSQFKVVQSVVSKDSTLYESGPTAETMKKLRELQAQDRAATPVQSEADTLMITSMNDKLGRLAEVFFLCVDVFGACSGFCNSIAHQLI